MKIRTTFLINQINFILPNSVHSVNWSCSSCYELELSFSLNGFLKNGTREIIIIIFESWGIRANQRICPAKSTLTAKARLWFWNVQNRGKPQKSHSSAGGVHVVRSKTAALSHGLYSRIVPSSLCSPLKLDSLPLTGRARLFVSLLMMSQAVPETKFPPFSLLWGGKRWWISLVYQWNSDDLIYFLCN